MRPSPQQHTLTHSTMKPVDLFELTEALDEFEAETNEELRSKLKHTKEPLPPFLETLVPGSAKTAGRPRRSAKKGTR